MVFKIAVFIKQVPDTTDIRWTEHNTIQREGLDSVINPFDLGAIQLAKNVKFLNKETEITAVTMIEEFCCRTKSFPELILWQQRIPCLNL